jgi:7-cyano-7-deazaguanine tRNA-ribosyltransferase
METLRPDPKPCRPQDKGLFEITKRDGWARIGKFHTEHGIINTPTLLPVINPNIRTIPPREMWDKYGIEALITNSYIIWKHEKLSQPALKSGIHELLDFPGMIMTDSGTFQSYIYGDVEVSNEEIVAFQRDIGVDVATMLDVFTRPDMSYEEWWGGVETTHQRASSALAAAKDTLLNGPIQGGLDVDLRKRSAQLMGQEGFTIHPIGGIVPLMEEHDYSRLFEIILHIRTTIPSERPVHMFGCGHPILFPFAIALGVDLFDSAAYVLFARDGRLLTPTGTVHLEGLNEWTYPTPSLFGVTPEQVRKMNSDERCAILARANLEVTLAELARCRQAVRDGKIWQLAELRSNCNPELKAAWNYLMHDYECPEGFDELTQAQHLQRPGGIRLMLDSPTNRPDLNQMRQTLAERWTPPPTTGWNGKGEHRFIVIFASAEAPWRMSIGEHVKRLLTLNPAAIPMISTPIGLLPYSLEDINPHAHLSHLISERRGFDEAFIEEELIALGLDGFSRNIIFHIEEEREMQELLDAMLQAKMPGEIDLSALENKDTLRAVEEWMKTWSAVDKLSLFAKVSPDDSWPALKGAKMVMSRTGRVKNILTHNGHHIASPRLTDGGLSLTLEGAKWIHSLSKTNDGKVSGPARVIVDSDAEPFVRQGRNVFHGFCIDADPTLSAGQACLIVNVDDELIGHGISQVNKRELMAFRKGIAIKVRDGVKDE